MSIRPHRPRRLTQSPFIGSNAIAAGLITREQLRGSSWVRLFRDVYASAALPRDHILRIKGAALLLPSGGAIAGRSAAVLWGAKLTDLHDTVEIVAPRGYGPVKGLAIRTGAVDPSEIVKRWGLPVTTALHTTWDLALYLPELDAVAWIDHLAHARRISFKQLVAYGATHRSARGGKRATEVLSLCDPRAESAPESKLRVHLVRSGLPAPIPQFQVFDARAFVARVDLAWPEIRLAVEYDGQWHADGGQLGRDRERVRTLNEVGWQVYSVTYEDMHDPVQLVRRIRRVYAIRIRELKRPAGA